MSWKISTFTFLIIGFYAFFADGQTIDRGPYLQSVTTESIFIKWRTDSSTDSKVWYGDSPNNLNFTVANPSNTTEHEVLINGLSSNTIYYYAVGNNSGQMAGADAGHYFKTSPDDSGNQVVRAWILGDCGTANDNQRDVRNAYYNFIGDEHTDAILLLGDNAYNDGTQSEYQMALFENMYEDKLTNSLLWSTFGNHDGHSALSVNQTGPYYDIFTFPKNAEAGGTASETEAFYSFDYGNIHFISVNSDDIDADPEGDMVQWIEADINSTDQEWIVAFFHHPSYTGEGGNESDIKASSIDMRENVLPVLEAGGVDLVMMGHTHAYQRSYLIQGHYDDSPTWDPDIMGIDLGDGRIDGDGEYFKERGEEGIGTVYIVAGSSGKLDSDDYNYPAMSQNVEEYGSVALEVDGLEMNVKFIDIDGTIRDYFTIVKMVDPPTVNITYPSDQQYFPNPETITITADASDVNGSVSQVEFFIENISIGSDNTEPYSINWTIPSDGSFKIKAVATDNEGYFRSSLVTINVGELEVCTRVKTGSDDAEEKIDGTVGLTSGDLELVNDGTDQIIGIRFQDLTIPQCAEINTAFIQFMTDDTDNINPCNLTIYAEASDNANTFIDDDFNISNRAKTVSSVVWSPENWDNIGDTGPAQKTIDISPLIQEVVNRPGFSPNSSIVIIIEGEGKRSAESYNTDPLFAPELCIEFKPNGPDDDNDGVCNALDQCPGSPEPGMPCDDGNAQTINDTVNSNCECIGEIVYDCPTIMANIGDVCDDGNPNTMNDKINSNCQCEGFTEFDCPSIPANIGDTCDDGNSLTYNDLINSNCECNGVLYDCPAFPANVGDACDDGNPDTSNDTVNSNCECIGEIIYDCPTIPANIGDPCDDGNANTENDMINSNCDCLGNIIYDCPPLQANIGDSCDDGNPDTVNDEINSNCECIGEIIYDCPTIPANIGDPCEDGNPDTSNDVIDANCDCVGSMFDCPLIQADIGDSCDDGDGNTFSDQIDSDCNCIGLSEISVIVSESSDDAEESENGSVSLTSSDLELVVDGNTIQKVGMRFINLNINQGAIIDSAFIQFTTDETNNLNPCFLNIYGEASDNAQTFLDDDNNISNRPQTNAVVVWSPEEWENINDAGDAQKTIDITSVIQEIVNRSGFNANSSIAILIDGEGKRTAVSYDGEPADAPKLYIKFKNTVVGLKQVSKNKVNPILVYPIPATDELNVAFESLKRQKVAIQILDLNGRILFSESRLAQAGENDFLINNLNLAIGMFFIQLYFDDVAQSAKFTIFK